MNAIANNLNPENFLGSVSIPLNRVILHEHKVLVHLKDKRQSVSIPLNRVILHELLAGTQTMGLKDKNVSIPLNRVILHELS